MLLAYNTKFAFNYNEFVDKQYIVNGDPESFRSMLDSKPEIVDGFSDSARLVLKYFNEIDIYTFDTSLRINESNIKFEKESRIPDSSRNKKATSYGVFDPFPDINFSPDEISNFEFEIENCNLAGISFLIGFHEDNCSPVYVDKLLLFPFDKNAIYNSFNNCQFIPFKIYLEFLEKKPNFEITFKFKAGYLQNRHRNMLLRELSITTENMVFGTGCFNVINEEKKYEMSLKYIKYK